jgi:hypothetical protein
MGFLDTLASFIPFSGSVDAEAPPKDEVEDKDSEVTKEDGGEEEEKDEEAKGEEQEEEEEEEEEDEVVDPAEAIREGELACWIAEEVDNSDALQNVPIPRSANPQSTTTMSALRGSPSRRRSLESQRRTASRSVSLPIVICSALVLIGTVFHLAHCVTGCAAPKLWNKLV